ncbi:MAG: hypothetical protein ACLFNT_03985, partial [Spirochaetales bacterium]
FGAKLEKYQEELRQEGREQGREEGREQGREEGREQGREEGREQGREEGREQGREEGEQRGREETIEQTLNAIRLLRGGASAQDVADSTGLPLESVQKLASEIGGGR